AFRESGLDLRESTVRRSDQPGQPAAADPVRLETAVLTALSRAMLAAMALAGAPWLTAALYAQRKDFTSAQACRACHPSQYERQSATGHALALRRTMEHPLAGRFTTAEPVPRPPKFHFTFIKVEEGIHVRADDGQYVTELPLEWAFGAGEHAVTFVTQ